MSMNQFMHPRNIYKLPPNFKQLALDYPEFRKFVIQDISGKVTFDFKNLEALRALSCTLLKKDFGVEIELPLNKLIPTIPLRLNYILWIEDLLNLAERNENIKGIDIGTGASCVYPIICAKKNNWFMVASDIDNESLKYATENVKRNNLEHLIKIIKVENNTLLEELTTKFPEQFDFCMCNPPFFASSQQLNPSFKARKLSRPRPKNAFCASLEEVVAEGGEIQYCKKLIEESKILSTRIKIYSTMIGHKSSLPLLKKQLRESQVVSFKQTEFCQGHTTRWGLAWTYNDIDLTKIPNLLIAAKQKTPKPLYYDIPKTESFPYKMSFLHDRLVALFRELEFEFQEIKHLNNLIEFIIVAYSNTWSHQRRKRRQQKKLCSDESNSGDSLELEKSPEIFKTCDKLAQLSCTSKRANDEDGFYQSKRLKTDSEENITSKIFLKAKISLMKVDAVFGLELIFYEGNGTKEALYQVLQYIKNNLMKNME